MFYKKMMKSEFFYMIAYEHAHKIFEADMWPQNYTLFKNLIKYL
jgi:hypothetical protein